MDIVTKKPKVLVVEDEKLLLRAITSNMEKSGIEAIPYSTGQEAIEMLRNLKSKEDAPDAIWLDYYMDGYDGLSFVEDFKKIENLSEIPIIVVSNFSDPEKVNKMLTLGVKKYFLKADNSLENLINSIKDLIKQEENK